MRASISLSPSAKAPRAAERLSAAGIELYSADEKCHVRLDADDAHEAWTASEALLAVYNAINVEKENLYKLFARTGSLVWKIVYHNLEKRNECFEIDLQRESEDDSSVPEQS